jgi:alpha-tubulin suppressor-like RCC1 family protein
MSVRRASALWLAGLTIAFLLVARHGAGSPISEATARLVARNFMAAHVQAHGSWNGAANPDIRAVRLVTYQGIPVAYHVPVTPTGHLLVAYDDQFSPVLLYSDRSSWDPAKVAEPGTLEAWIVDETYRTLERLNQMDSATRRRLQARATRESIQVESAWARFGREKGRAAPRAAAALALGSLTTQVVVGPFLTTAWDQGTTTAPFTYNLYTPAIPGLGGCGRTYAGCTATATAQLMKFWNWPPTGTGSHSYAWNGQTLSTDFTRTYNWGSMPDALSASSSATQIDAVARLMFDVGIASDMNYSCTGSGASVWDAVSYGMPMYFRYRWVVQGMARSDYTGDQFFRIMGADIDAGRPLLLEVRSATDGHAVVVDGYQVFTDSTSQVHVNLGWGGAYTGWYDITNNWSTGYNWIASTQVAYRGIEPDDGVARRPGAPVLLGPSGALDPAAPPTFTWAAVPHAVRYRVTAYQGWSDPANPATGTAVYHADSVTPDQAGCANNIGDCSWAADGAIPAAVLTAFTVGAINDIDPDWDDASPYFQFTISRVGAPSASAVGQTSTIVSAPVNPNGVTTTAYFEYGITTDYGSTSAPQSLGAGTTTVTLTATMNSLMCGATYHYRAVATDSGGTTAGADGTFTTLPCGAPAMVAAGAAHTCVLTTGGGVACWGANDSGQLGDGTTTDRPAPVPVAGLATGVAAIAAGDNHTCLLTTAGGVKCWGANDSGQLGDGTTTHRLSPVPVAGLGSGVTAIAAGVSHTCAVTTSGGVTCWGSNSNRQLGDGTTTTHTVPVSVNGLTSAAVAVAAGGLHTCALTTGGGVQCWGDNTTGELGDGTSMTRTVPVAVGGLTSDVATIAAGDYHTCAVMTAGDVRCWGANDSGQLGDGTVLMLRTAPVPVTGLAAGVTAIAAGLDHTCAVTTGGGVQCWGGNGYGQLGDGTRSAGRRTAGAVSGLATGVAAIGAGDYYTCALTTGGGAACWGRGDSGQLGDGTRTNRAGPTAVALLVPPCIFSIAPSSASPGFPAGSQPVTVTAAPAGCTDGGWTASANESWLTVSPASGNGSGLTTVSWTENVAYAPRVGSAAVAGSSFMVTQGATTPPTCAGFTISPMSASPTYAAGQQVVTLTGRPSGCVGGNWTAATNGSWLTVSPASGTGPAQVTVSWTQNQVEASRSDSATVAGSVFSVTQAALPPVIFTDDPLLVRTTAVKVVHLVELRAAIGQLRARHRLGPFNWTDPTIVAGVTVVKAVHLTELRTALNEVYAAVGREAPAYTGTISAGVTTITAAQINELRAAILAIW